MSNFIHKMINQVMPGYTVSYIKDQQHRGEYYVVYAYEKNRRSKMTYPDLVIPSMCFMRKKYSNNQENQKNVERNILNAVIRNMISIHIFDENTLNNISMEELNRDDFVIHELKTMISDYKRIKLAMSIGSYSKSENDGQQKQMDIILMMLNLRKNLNSKDLGDYFSEEVRKEFNHSLEEFFQSVTGSSMIKSEDIDPSFFTIGKFWTLSMEEMIKYSSIVCFEKESQLILDAVKKDIQPMHQKIQDLKIYYNVLKRLSESSLNDIYKTKIQNVFKQIDESLGFNQINFDPDNIKFLENWYDRMIEERPTGFLKGVFHKLYLYYCYQLLKGDLNGEEIKYYKNRCEKLYEKWNLEVQKIISSQVSIEQEQLEKISDVFFNLMSSKIMDQEPHSDLIKILRAFNFQILTQENNSFSEFTINLPEFLRDLFYEFIVLREIKSFSKYIHNRDCAA